MAEQEAKQESSSGAPERKSEGTETAQRQSSPSSGGKSETRSGSRRDRPQRGGRSGDRRRFYRRKKVDYFSVNKIDDINYKDVHILKQFIGDRGKILPRRHTGLSALHQRKLKIAIKRARNIALLPFGGETDWLKSEVQERRPQSKSET